MNKLRRGALPAHRDVKQPSNAKCDRCCRETDQQLTDAGKPFAATGKERQLPTKLGSPHGLSHLLHLSEN